MRKFLLTFTGLLTMTLIASSSTSSKQSSNATVTANGVSVVSNILNCSFMTRYNEVKSSGLSDYFWGSYAASNKSIIEFESKYNEIKSTKLPDVFWGKYAASNCTLN